MSKLLEHITNMPECVEEEHYWIINTTNPDLWFTLNEEEDMTIKMYAGAYQTQMDFEEFKQYEGLIDKNWR